MIGNIRLAHELLSVILVVNPGLAMGDSHSEAVAEGAANSLGELMKKLGFQSLGGSIPAVEHIVNNMDEVRNPCRNTLRLLGAIFQDARDGTGDNFAHTIIRTFDVPQFGSWTYAKLLEQGERLSKRIGRNRNKNLRAIRQAMREIRLRCSGRPRTPMTTAGSPRPASTAGTGGKKPTTTAPPSRPTTPTPRPTESPPPPLPPKPAWSVDNPCPACKPIADSIAVEKGKLDATHKRLAGVNQDLARVAIEFADIARARTELKARIDAQEGAFAQSTDPQTGLTVRAENIGDGKIQVTTTDADGRMVDQYERNSYSQRRAKAKHKELDTKEAALKNREAKLQREQTGLNNDLQRLEASIRKLQQALGDCVRSRCNEVVDCPQPAAKETIRVGSNSDVGSGARTGQKATETLTGLAGSALGGLLGGTPFGGGSQKDSGPKTVDDPVDDGAKQRFTDPATGTQIAVGATVKDGQIIVSTGIEESPDNGTFQTVYVQDAEGRRAGPIGYYLYELWLEWSITVSWTYDRWVNNEHVEHREGGWDDAGSELLDSFTVPLQGEGTAVWEKLGFGNASHGCKGLGTRYPIGPAELAKKPLDLVVHITRPSQNPVTTVPFILHMTVDDNGAIQFTQAESSMAAEACDARVAADDSATAELPLDMVTLTWDYGKYSDWTGGIYLGLDSYEIGTGEPAELLGEDGADATPAPADQNPPSQAPPVDDSGQSPAPPMARTESPAASSKRVGDTELGTHGLTQPTPTTKARKPTLDELLQDGSTAVISIPETPSSQYGEEQEDSPIGILLVRNDWAWIPRFANETYVTAQLYAKSTLGRWIPTQRKRVIKVRFDRRSSETGMDLNTDLGTEPQDSADLYLPGGDNSHSNCSDDESGHTWWRQCVTKTAVSRQTFEVRSRDFGAFSKMLASCDACVPLRPPARWLQGIPPEAFPADTSSGQQLLTVPADRNDNQIADAWVWEIQRLSLTATEDRDNQPIGNGVRGDGLSAYEEYRGFHAKGRHLRTSPDTKDLFVDNRDNLPIEKFEASGLAIHEVSRHELEDRRINFNSGHAHVVDQHGLILVNKKLSKGTVGFASHGWYDTLLGRIGPPKYVDEVQVDRAQNIMKFGRLVSDSNPEVVAHELGHAVKLRHHGPRGKVKKYLVSQDSTVSKPVFPGFLSWSSAVKISGARLCNRKLPAKIEFGEKHNVFSGHTACFMRYEYGPYAYKQEDGTIQCRPSEPDATLFDDSKSGGYNAGNQVAGNATRGECKKQMQVNDK